MLGGTWEQSNSKFTSQMQTSDFSWKPLRGSLSQHGVNLDIRAPAVDLPLRFRVTQLGLWWPALVSCPRARGATVRTNPLLGLRQAPGVGAGCSSSSERPWGNTVLHYPVSPKCVTGDSGICYCSDDKVSDDVIRQQFTEVPLPPSLV